MNWAIGLETYLREAGLEHLEPIFSLKAVRAKESKCEAIVIRMESIYIMFWFQITLPQLAVMTEVDFIRMGISKLNELHKLKRLCYELNNPDVSF